MDLIKITPEDADRAAPLVAAFRAELKALRGITAQPDLEAGKEEILEFLVELGIFRFRIGFSLVYQGLADSLAKFLIVSDSNDVPFVIDNRKQKTNSFIVFGIRVFQTPSLLFCEF